MGLFSLGSRDRKISTNSNNNWGSPLSRGLSNSPRKISTISTLSPVRSAHEENNRLRMELTELRERLEFQNSEINKLRNELRKMEGIATEWKEKYNFQNFKLRVLIDSWVLNQVSLTENIEQFSSDSESPIKKENSSNKKKIKKIKENKESSSLDLTEDEY